MVRDEVGKEYEFYPDDNTEQLNDCKIIMNMYAL